MLFDTGLVCQFQIYRMKRSVLKIHALNVIFEGWWWFLTGYLEDWVILDIMENNYVLLMRCVPIFSYLALIKFGQEQCVLEDLFGGLVCDRILRAWGHLWHHGSPLYVIQWFYVDFQLSSMNRSVTRTTCPWRPTLGASIVPDWILGKWDHSWSHGSS